MSKKIALAVVVFAMAVSAMAFAGGKQAKQISGVVNINTATALELMLLPGVGKSKADTIIAYRQTKPFKAATDITNVKGIGGKMFERLQQNVSVDGPTTAKVIKAQP